ncbi:MAG: zinc-dependent alcohol dehydrogenase family protein [Chloroflexi bacterium]|nr:zinc-dependent alcohol dehydrogenase family protein [Chloroflexota bacterium]
MQALKILRPNQTELVNIPIPDVLDRALLVKVMASGICGTDIHILRGEYLGAYPVIPGHEFAGVIEKVGAGVSRFKPGDRVAVEPNIACDNCANCLNNRQNFCLNWRAVGVTLPGGMAQYVVAPEQAAFDIGDLAFEQGAFMEPLSCVLHGVERLNPQMADRVALLGAGPIGCLLLQALHLRGASHVLIVDKNHARLELARALGASICLDDLDQLERDHYDTVVDATGAIPVMSRALEFARPGGKVLLFGVPPQGAKITLDAFTIFRKGLTILSSFTSVRNSLQAVALLQSERIRVADLISHRLPLRDFERGIELIEQGAENVKKVMLLPNG